MRKEKIYHTSTGLVQSQVGQSGLASPKAQKYGTTYSCPELNVPINMHCKLILSEKVCTTK